MKQHLLFVLFAIACAFQATAQSESLTLTPQWKHGDTRMLTVLDVRTEVKDGETTVDRDEVQAEFQVVQETPSVYILQVEYDNVVLRHAEKLSESFTLEGPEAANFILRYSVDRKTGASELQNWKEVQGFVLSSFETIQQELEEKDPDNASIFQLIMLPILSVFDNRENVEAYFHGMIDLVTAPFGKALIQGDTLREVQLAANPFSPGDSLSTTTLTTLESVDLEKQQAVIRTETQMDMRPFVDAMKAMVGSMMKAMITDPEEQRANEAKMSAGMDSVQFDIKNERFETIDLRTTWPLDAITTVQVSTDMMDAKNSAINISTLTVEEAGNEEPFILHPDSSVVVYGQVMEFESTDSIPFPAIQVENLTDGRATPTVISDGEGNYEFYLGQDRSYRITYSAPDHLKKSVVIDLVNIPDSAWSDGGLGMNIQMTLLKKLPGLDESLFDGDIGRSSYDAASGTMAWDLPYTEQMKARMSKALESYRKALDKK